MVFYRAAALYLIFKVTKTIKNKENNSNCMKQNVMIILKKEYEGMKETIEILQDEELMDQIKESEENLKKGIKFKKLDI